MKRRVGRRFGGRDRDEEDNTVQNSKPSKKVVPEYSMSSAYVLLTIAYTLDANSTEKKAKAKIAEVRRAMFKSFLRESL